MIRERKVVVLGGPVALLGRGGGLLTSELPEPEEHVQKGLSEDECLR